MSAVVRTSIQCTCTSSSMYSWQGSTRYGASAPPADPCILHSSHLSPIPLHGLLLRSYGGGWGARTALVTIVRVVTGHGRPLPSPKNNNSDDGKGAETLAVSRPISSLMTYACTSACKQEQAAKPRRRSRRERENQNNKAEPKGKGQEGFLGCGCQVGIPTFNTCANTSQNPSCPGSLQMAKSTNHYE